jgi:O-antigen ligase
MRYLAWICFGLLAFSNIMTGSRGAIIALAVGFICFLLRPGRLAGKLKTGFVIVLAMICVSVIGYQVPFVRSRWEKAVESGSMSGRENIYPKAAAMVLDRPLVGWGPFRNFAELGTRVGQKDVDTHNLYLLVLTETGLLGGLPYFIGLWFCWRTAWKTRHGTRGILPLAMLSCVLVVNMSLSWHNRKLHWFVLSYAIASTAFIPKKSRRLPVVSGRPNPLLQRAAARRFRTHIQPGSGDPLAPGRMQS